MSAREQGGAARDSVVVLPKPADDATMQAELDKLRAQREALAAARQARADQNTLAAKLAAEQRALRDEQAIDAAEQEHGEIGRKIQVVKSELGVVIVKRAHPAAFKRFLDRGEHKTKDLEALARLCLVYPSLSEWEAMCDELPILINRSADAVAYLAGVRTEDLSGKS